MGSTPLLELRNLTDLVRSVSEPGKGARIFVKDEAANLAGSVQGRAAPASASTRPSEKGYEGVIAATSGNYGAAVASQAARNGLKCIIVQEIFDSPPRRPARDRREGPRLRGLRRRGRADDASGRSCSSTCCALLDATGYFAASLYTQLRRERHRDSGSRDRAARSRAPDGGVPDARRRHPRRRRQHHRHGPRPGARRLRPTRNRQRSRVDLSGLHMAQRRDFNRKCFTTGHTGFGVPFATWPDRADVPRNAARPLRYIDATYRHAGRGVLRDRGCWPSSRAWSAARRATPP